MRSSSQKGLRCKKKKVNLDTPGSYVAAEAGSSSGSNDASLRI